MSGKFFVAFGVTGRCLLLFQLGSMFDLDQRAVGAVTFTQVTTQAQITHVQSTPELVADLPGPAFMTGGVAAGDFDGDGRVDLIFTRLNDVDIFYRNKGDGTFESRTTSAGFHEATLSNGVVSGDIDNDGDLDLYVTTTSGTRNFLYLNDGSGFFSDAGADRVASLNNGKSRFGQGASFGDYDRDGYLDLITADWGSQVADSQSRLLRNLGGSSAGQFEDVTETAGIDLYRKSTAYRFSPRFVDLDQDGHLDLAIASDFQTSQLFWNNGDGTFTDGTLPAEVGTDFNGMGSTFGDYDGDGDLDWFITNITAAPGGSTGFGGWNRLYRNDGNRVFTDVTQAAGVRDSRWAWGTSFFDYDNDGDLDLIATNGYNGEGWLDDRTFLWRNDNGVFVDVSDEVGISDTGQGRGLIHLDYDDDGDLDIVVINNEAAPVLYRNDGGSDNHYLRIAPVGTESNRDAIGARIYVTPDANELDKTLLWEIDGGSSFLSQNEHTAHFGLGDSAESVAMVRIVWPNGIEQYLFDVMPDQTVSVFEADQWSEADFDGSGKVSAVDYTRWRDQLGEAGGADGSGNGVVDWQDYLLWKTHYGRGATVGQAASTIVPEPTSLVAWVVLVPLLSSGIGRRLRRLRRPRRVGGA